MKKRLIILTILALPLMAAAAEKPAKHIAGLLHDILQIEQVHPDSVYPFIQRIEEYKTTLLSAEACAVCDLCLGRLYSERAYWAQYAGYEDNMQRSHAAFRQAFAQPDMLVQMKGKKWAPLVTKGKGEDAFGGDMLGVAWRTMRNALGAFVADTLQGVPRSGWMIDHYLQQGNRRAAFLLAQDSLLQSNTPALQLERELLKLRERFQDVPDVAQLYIHLSHCEGLSEQQRKAYLVEGLARYPKYKGRNALQNELLSLTDPVFQWSGPTLLYPDKTYEWQLRARNMQGVAWQGTEHAFVGAESDVDWVSDTLQWQSPAAVGKHTLWFLPQPKVKTKKKPKRREQEVFVSRLQMLTQSLPDGQLRLIVTDRQTGQPQCDAMIELFREADDTVAYTRRYTDTQGCVQLSVPREKNRYQPLYVRLSNSEERHHAIQTLRYGQPWYDASRFSAHHVELYADRAIYRPGQEVKLGGIAYKQRGWQARTQDGESITLILRDAQRKEVERKSVTTDSLGVFEATFTLPTNRRNGNWTVQADEQQIYLRVEQYKRPTFTVVLNDSLQRTADTLTVTGSALRYDGMPLRYARVAANSTLLSYGRYGGAPNASHRDTVQTDAEGRFSFVVPNDTSCTSVRVALDVLSSYGEQQHAKRHYSLRPERPQPTKVDSTFLAICPRDTFDAARPTEITLSTTAAEAWVYYTLSVNGSVHKDTLLHLTRGAHTLPVMYDAAYGDGAVVSLATVIDEKVYTHTQHIRLCKPDMRLVMRWDSFRDKTQPGARERWQLTLTRPDGTPAHANVLATLYDASLERLQRHRLGLDVALSHQLFAVPYRQVRLPYYEGHLYESYTQKRKKLSVTLLPQLDDALFVPRMAQDMVYGSPRVYKATRNVMMMDAAAAPAMSNQEMVVGSKDLAEEEGTVMRLQGTGQSDTNTDATAALPLRENFQETAFFMPRLRTDAQGQAVMEFTLPESTTTWRLQAVAHTQDMMYTAFLHDIVAQKPVMAQARLPRFLRVGDEAQLSGSLTNATDQPQAVRATMQLLDAKTQKVLLTERKQVTLQPQADTTFTFIYKVGEADVLVRWSVEGKDCTDGEQHLLSVLPTDIEITNTLPITAMNAGVYTYDLKELYPAEGRDYTVVAEYTAYPEQLALQALPALARTKGCDALSLTASLYAQVLAKHLGVQAEDSTEVLLQRLRDMQRSDGGMAWYPGMPSTRYISLEVAYLLARLQMLTHQPQDDAMLRRIVGYLLNDKSRVREMGRNEKLRTLYVVQAANLSLARAEQQKVDSLVDNVKDLKPEQTDLEGQALAAIVLHRQGLERKAEAMVEAFRPRLVSAPQQGTYIEWPQGPWRSIDRKLDIHVQLMEALQAVDPQATELLGGMRRHLLLQKRMQLWDTPVQSANAIFALMNGYRRQPQVAHDVLRLYSARNRALQSVIAPVDSLGYVRDTLDAAALPAELRLTKASEGQSWGAVYASCYMPYQHVEADTTGLAVRQQVPVGAKAGSRITLTQRIMADADYEYVTVVVPRPAALEPVEQLSGCRYQDGLCYYLEVADSELRYHILSIPRGHYRFAQDYYVERSGQYHMGVSTIRCTLAPELQGRDADKVMVVD